MLQSFVNFLIATQSGSVSPIRYGTKSGLNVLYVEVQSATKTVSFGVLSGSNAGYFVAENETGKVDVFLNFNQAVSFFMGKLA